MEHVESVWFVSGNESGATQRPESRNV